jgi:trans-feruloyl-CoA hydratase/vanillin synthase
MLRIEDFGDGVRGIGLDRAAKRNAIGIELTFALEQALLQVRDDMSVRAVVFHGIGGHFSAGMDMKDFFDSSERPADELQRAREATEHWRTHLLRTLPQKVVTAVQGYCFGGALPIASFSDAVVAERSATFGLPEINFGFVPGAQILKAVGEVMDPRGFAHAALTGRSFGADQALAWGLATAVCESAPLQPAIALARSLARGESRSDMRRRRA